MRDGRRAPSYQALACALGLLTSTVLGIGFLYAPDGSRELAATSVAHLALPKSDIALVRDRKSIAPPSMVRSALIDPTLTSAWEATPFARSAPLRSRSVRAEPARVGFETIPRSEAEAELEERTQVAVAEPLVVTGVSSVDAQAVSLPEANLPEASGRGSDVPPLVRDEVARTVPLPLPRPSFARAVPAPSTRYALREAPPAPSAAIVPPTDGRTLLERMFGAPATPSQAPANPALAYATPGDTGSGFFGSRPAASAGSGTAVYNISAHTVTLPDGTRLEAHSGLGTSLDNPASVTQRMRGATPPSLYELTQREALFHGVRALRLTPLLEGTTFGRGGLLAHTFMLGPRGDSNGCVVFRNYQAFLAAYDSGQIRRLLVVAGT